MGSQALVNSSRLQPIASSGVTLARSSGSRICQRRCTQAYARMNAFAARLPLSAAPGTMVSPQVAARESNINTGILRYADLRNRL